MKKALFATTALVAFAGAASAEVTISGWAEMGIVGGDRFITGTLMSATQFWNDVDIEFTLSGESDSGISFGARVDLDEAGNLGNTFRNQGTSIFISGNFGTLTLGDTDGALDWALTDAGNIGNPGSISDDETTHAGYLPDYGDGGGLYNGFAAIYDNQILRYDYSFGDFGVHVSSDNPGPAGDQAVGIAVSWSMGDFSAGLGYETDADGSAGGVDNHLIAGASIGFGDATIKGIFGTADLTAGGSAEQWGLSLDYSMGGVTATAFYVDKDAALGSEAWGIGGAYDLGGGASLKGGYVSNETTGNDGFDFGLSMTF